MQNDAQDGTFGVRVVSESSRVSPHSEWPALADDSIIANPFVPA